MVQSRFARTLLDKMLALIEIVAIKEPFYFVADAFYAARKIVNGLLDQNNHLVTRVKSNAVAYAPHLQRDPHKRGRPRLYGMAQRSGSNHCSTPPRPRNRLTRWAAP